MTERQPPGRTRDRAGVSLLDAARERFSEQGLNEGDLPSDPFDLLGRWREEAESAGVYLPDVVALASATPDGVPSVRMVQLKEVSADGFTFFTHLASRKGTELRENPSCALVFPWHAIERQVCVRGRAQILRRAEAAAYFATRPRASQLAAHASPQTRPVSGPEELERAYAQALERFDRREVPIPTAWGGLRVIAQSIEFWQGRAGRMHDRLMYRRVESEWVIERLAP